MQYTKDLQDLEATNTQIMVINLHSLHPGDVLSAESIARTVRIQSERHQSELLVYKKINPSANVATSPAGDGSTESVSCQYGTLTAPDDLWYADGCGFSGEEVEGW